MFYSSVKLKPESVEYSCVLYALVLQYIVATYPLRSSASPAASTLLRADHTPCCLHRRARESVELNPSAQAQGVGVPSCSRGHDTPSQPRLLPSRVKGQV